MIPLLIFLVACAGVYLGAIEAAFSALMRLSLRLAAERSDRPDRLGAYLDDPILLFVPVRLLLGVMTAMATALLADVIGLDGAHRFTPSSSSRRSRSGPFELSPLPLAIVSRDPERALEVLLPSFSPIAQALGPFARWSVRSVPTKKSGAGTGEDAAKQPDEEAKEYDAAAKQEGLIDGEERQLLQSIVDFGDTLVCGK